MTKLPQQLTAKRQKPFCYKTLLFRNKVCFFLPKGAKLSAQYTHCPLFNFNILKWV